MVGDFTKAVRSEGQMEIQVTEGNGESSFANPSSALFSDDFPGKGRSALDREQGNILGIAG